MQNFPKTAAAMNQIYVQGDWEKITERTQSLGQKQSLASQSDFDASRDAVSIYGADFPIIPDKEAVLLTIRDFHPIWLGLISRARSACFLVPTRISFAIVSLTRKKMPNSDLGSSR